MIGGAAFEVSAVREKLLRELEQWLRAINESAADSLLEAFNELLARSAGRLGFLHQVQNAGQGAVAGGLGRADINHAELVDGAGEDRVAVRF